MSLATAWLLGTYPHPQIWGGVPSELKYKNNGVGLRQKKSAGGVTPEIKYGPKNGVHGQAWPIWAKAHMGPGPLGPGPFRVGRTPHQKTHPGKNSPNCVF